MHIFEVLVVIPVQFKIDFLKTLGGGDYTNLLPTLYLSLTVKIVQVENSVILSKITFSSSKSHMHIFNMLTSVQSFRLNA